jgi:hypothetical protein
MCTSLREKATMSKNPRPEDVAEAVLGWLADEPRRIAAFLDATGLAPGDIRAMAETPAFRAALIDHILGDERMLLSFCADCGLPPEAPARARAALPGGDLPHWT